MDEAAGSTSHCHNSYYLEELPKHFGKNTRCCWQSAMRVGLFVTQVPNCLMGWRWLFQVVGAHEPNGRGEQIRQISVTWLQAYGARRTVALYHAWLELAVGFVMMTGVPCPGWSVQSPILVQENPQLVVMWRV